MVRHRFYDFHKTNGNRDAKQFLVVLQKVMEIYVLQKVIKYLYAVFLT